VSTALFPSTLKGFDIEVERETLFSTLVQTAASGKELRARFWSTPRFLYTLNLNFVRQSGFSAKTLTDELAQLATFFNQVYGRWDSFLYVDPVNGTPSGCYFATGDGTTNPFQLTDNEGWTAANLQGTPSIYVNGVLKTGGVDYSVNVTTGVVTFTAAPANATTLTWSGQFARPCRFDDDSLNFKRFVNLAWEGGAIKIRSLK
jgi:uncharacterized protein (TIGR02217 family)